MPIAQDGWNSAPRLRQPLGFDGIQLNRQAQIWIDQKASIEFVSYLSCMTFNVGIQEHRKSSSERVALKEWQR